MFCATNNAIKKKKTLLKGEKNYIIYQAWYFCPNYLRTFTTLIKNNLI